MLKCNNDTNNIRAFKLLSFIVISFLSFSSKAAGKVVIRIHVPHSIKHKTNVILVNNNNNNRPPYNPKNDAGYLPFNQPRPGHHYRYGFNHRNRYTIVHTNPKNPFINRQPVKIILPVPQPNFIPIPAPHLGGVLNFHKQLMQSMPTVAPTPTPTATSSPFSASNVGFETPEKNINQYFYGDRSVRPLESPENKINDYFYGEKSTYPDLSSERFDFNPEDDEKLIRFESVKIETNDGELAKPLIENGYEVQEPSDEMAPSRYNIEFSKQIAPLGFSQDIHKPKDLENYADEDPEAKSTSIVENIVKFPLEQYDGVDDYGIGPYQDFDSF